MSEALEAVSHHSLTFGQKLIPFQITFRPKLRLSITVMPNRQVLVAAPEGQELEKILALVKKRAGWIAKKRNYFEQFHPLPKKQQFVSGETHLYLGRQYRLKIHRSASEEVKLIGSYFHIYLEDPSDYAKAQKALDNWYEKRAQTIFRNKVDTFLEKHPSLKLTPNKVMIKRMEKRWGSCTKSSNVRFNLDLIKAPLYCIEYVIAHELCHLKVHNHSLAFYRLLRRFLPDWEKRKARLDNLIL